MDSERCEDIDGPKKPKRVKSKCEVRREGRGRGSMARAGAQRLKTDWRNGEEVPA